PEDPQHHHRPDDHRPCEHPARVPRPGIWIGREGPDEPEDAEGQPAAPEEKPLPADRGDHSGRDHADGPEQRHPVNEDVEDQDAAGASASPEASPAAASFAGVSLASASPAGASFAEAPSAAADASP